MFEHRSWRLANIAYRKSQKKLGQEYSSVDRSGQEEIYSYVLFFIKGREILKICFPKGEAGTYSDINNFHRGKGVDKRENNSEKEDQLFSSRNFFEHYHVRTCAGLKIR